MGVVKLADYRPQLEVVEHRVADTEDGFMRVANEITDSLLMADLTVRQLKVMLAIMRKTYGFNKPMDRLTNTQIAAMTGIHHTHVCAAKRQLIERKFLIADGVKIGVNKVVSQWISQDSLTLAKTANKTLAESANGYKPSQLNTKDNIQKTINTNTPLLQGCFSRKSRLSGRKNFSRRTLMLMRLVIAVLCVSWLLNIQTRLNPFVKAWDSLMKSSVILSAP